MNEVEIKKTWKNLIIPFLSGVVVLVGAILYNQYGSKRSVPQALSMYAMIAGAGFIIAPGIKMISFHRFLKNEGKNRNGDDKENPGQN